jgi:hypothetical protein
VGFVVPGLGAHVAGTDVGGCTPGAVSGSRVSLLYSKAHVLKAVLEFVDCTLLLAKFVVYKQEGSILSAVGDALSDVF